MMPRPKSSVSTLTSLLLVFGCGGRSDTTADYEGITTPSATGGVGGVGSTSTSLPIGTTPAAGGWEISWGGSQAYGGTDWSGGTSYGTTISRGGTAFGGTSYGSTTSRGGTTARGGTTSSGGTLYGGSTARGGSSFGGTTSLGGSTFIGTGNVGGYSTESCCTAHAATGCNDSAILQCVCRRDAVCCTIGWDATCVKQVVDFNCGKCVAVGSGGTSGTGGSGTGGIAQGGTVATGGYPSMGGTFATGGTLGVGGTTVMGQAMIDDLEDGNGDIINAEGRQGYWYTFNDSTQSGTQSPVWGGRIMTALALGERDGTKFVAWTAGSGFSDWGAGLGLYLKGNSGFYNAKKYRGITFWAKIDPGRANVVRLNIADDQTVPVDTSGSCTDCWDHFGVNVVFTTSWQRYSFLWSNLSQGGWGAPLAKEINSAKLRSIEFSTQPSVDFAIYIDDIAFIP